MMIRLRALQKNMRAIYDNAQGQKHKDGHNFRG